MTLLGILKFLDEVVWLIKTLQKTPEQERDAMMAVLRAEAESFNQTGRPRW